MLARLNSSRFGRNLPLGERAEQCTKLPKKVLIVEPSQERKTRGPSSSSLAMRRSVRESHRLPLRSLSFYSPSASFALVAASIRQIL